MSNELSAAILRRILDDVKGSGGTFGPEHGTMLMAIYHNEPDMTLFQAAVELVEKSRVTRITATPSGRTLVRVSAPSHHGAHAMHICFAHYCSCDAFHEATVHGRLTMCKHMLAALLADAVAKMQQVTVADSEFANLLCSDDATM
ncbi:hypothetical protein, variant [Saprolegnia diclina VS20]|uniref:SWIM-type domain-containing protein n=1 Tax=Saprolegnia diclina (strain VS20) TaxID=1156394 RepID=T0QGA7_SAPDV|nr:hypothetical protein SDRG_08470 [Saprolegnia diclina VS20]XP_008612581.1 hypothetical protein, variant [Saprolegnia diclina VS20]EQC33785.1 hypothetical protein SDRG_08470 [Saprolegnia diclina VS20]EQC33786.1 hypothetical protein, variant [Saprolegnia diclina VS20]|eukprot:XP_008612580.1 hypothetical protein SDRG_08470 [Saprolegnia diclina VS20]